MAKRAARERESEEGDGEGEASEKQHLGALAAVPCARRRDSSVGACGSNGGARSRAWRTRWQFIEHVAGNGVAGVGSMFGPVMGQIGPWAQR